MSNECSSNDSPFRLPEKGEPKLIKEENERDKGLDSGGRAAVSVTERTTNGNASPREQQPFQPASSFLRLTKATRILRVLMPNFGQVNS
jgi:hypothetical protein